MLAARGGLDVVGVFWSLLHALDEPFGVLPTAAPGAKTEAEADEQQKQEGQTERSRPCMHALPIDPCKMRKDTHGGKRGRHLK